MEYGITSESSPIQKEKERKEHILNVIEGY